VVFNEQCRDYRRRVRMLIPLPAKTAPDVTTRPALGMK